MIKVFILILFFLAIKINAQELNRSQLDSVYNLYTSLRGINPSVQLQKDIEIDPAIIKCGLGLVEEIKTNLSSFSIEQQSVLSKILQRPSLPNTIVCPNGFYLIHYATIGTDAIGYDINLLAQALDSAYNFEINYLGYPPPPSDGTEGGDGRYDIYVRNLGNLYGQTTSESKVGATNWTSFIEIDNDFGSGFYTHGIDAARVTVAHEFHHAIQMGNYAPANPSSAIRSSDTYFYELTSTSMEEFVYSSVNDYYAYMPDYFRNPERPMPLNNGYNLAIWNIFLKDSFGFDIIKRQWEMMPTAVALNVISQSIIEKGYTFGFELNTFGIWTYYTNNRSVAGKYFSEAVNYPLIEPTSTVTFSPPSQKYDMSIGPTGNYFLKINLSPGDGTLYSIVTNSDIQKALSDLNQVFSFSYSIYNDITSGNKVLSNMYSVTFSKENQTFWNNSGILNDIIVYGDSSFTIPNIEEEAFSYPAPFRYSTDNGIGITIAFQSDVSVTNDLDFNVYSSAMNLIYDSKVLVERSYFKNSKSYFEFTWNALDNNKKHLNSGVYVFIIKIGSEIKKGKLVIFSD